MAGRGLKTRDDLDPAAPRRFAGSEPDRRAALRALAIARALEGASRADAARLVGRERRSLRDAVRCGATTPKAWPGCATARGRGRPRS
jgi:hypothetical protein